MYKQQSFHFTCICFHIMCGFRIYLNHLDHLVAWWFYNVFVLQASDASQRKQSTYAPPTMKGKTQDNFQPDLPWFLQNVHNVWKCIRCFVWGKQKKTISPLRRGLIGGFTWCISSPTAILTGAFFSTINHHENASKMRKWWRGERRDDCSTMPEKKN